MDDNCRIKLVDLQENGILREGTGLIIGRVDREFDFNGLVESDDVMTPIMQAEIEALNRVASCAIDFIDQNESIFDRMEVAEYDTLVDAVKPYRSK